jgi:hypothetical protein
MQPIPYDVPERKRPLEDEMKAERMGIARCKGKSNWDQFRSGRQADESNNAIKSTTSRTVQQSRSEFHGIILWRNPEEYPSVQNRSDINADPADRTAPRAAAAACGRNSLIRMQLYEAHIRTCVMVQGRQYKRLHHTLACLSDRRKYILKSELSAARPAARVRARSRLTKGSAV